MLGNGTKVMPHSMSINESFDPQDKVNKETDTFISAIAKKLSEVFLKELRDPSRTSVSHLSSQDVNLS